MNIILASESPRRRELLQLMGLTFTVEPSDIEEEAPKHETVAKNVMELARQKAAAVFRHHPDACVIGADTVVDLDGMVLGKPHTPENARAYLKRMQGRSHTVYTGVAVLTPGREDVQVCETQVTFAPMTDREIDWYVSTGEPLDKAGAYGVQGPAAVFVKEIQGNYFNVIGMPVPLLYRMLLDAGVMTEDRT
ncbi:MAG: septum formation inhibitor Maf [Clostridia bacterium]|nr:septum formation inhibitor Maf [Clostridia bacterium]